jgi:lysyl-tRNA synthetase class 2
MDRLAAKRDNLRLRARIIRLIRDFFACRNYLEVDTPNRIPAPAPEAHIDAVPSGNWFLHTSPELCMKRLLASGYTRIFQICKCYRGSERGDRHLPEFTMLEWYRAGADYRDLMAECEDLVIDLAGMLERGKRILFRGKWIALEKPWERITVRDAFSRYSPVSLKDALAAGSFDEVMAFEIEARLPKDRPVFLYDYPVSLGALAREGRNDPSVAERFELYLGGMELVNAFSELRDPDEQRRRFELEKKCRELRGAAVYPDPVGFLECLSGMPESAGAALGMDRLVMIFCNAESIDDVVAFTPEEL